MSQQRFEEMGSKGGCGQGRRLGDASRQWWVARRYLACVLLLVLFISGCAIFKAEMDLPPLLAQDEVVRPFTKLAVVQVSVSASVRPMILKPKIMAGHMKR